MRDKYTGEYKCKVCGKWFDPLDPDDTHNHEDELAEKEAREEEHRKEIRRGKDE